MTDEAEKEASEVLHSLLRVERIENKTQHNLLAGQNFSVNDNTDTPVKWHTPVFGDQSIFKIDDDGQLVHSIEESQVSDLIVAVNINFIFIFYHLFNCRLLTGMTIRSTQLIMIQMNQKHRILV